MRKQRTDCQGYISLNVQRPQLGPRLKCELPRCHRGPHTARLRSARLMWDWVRTLTEPIEQHGEPDDAR